MVTGSTTYVVVDGTLDWFMSIFDYFAVFIILLFNVTVLWHVWLFAEWSEKSEHD